LSLDKKDVDFIHDIIQRTHGDQRVSNRITALREAYVRAANKRNDLLKTKKKFQINENKPKKKLTMKHSMSASKIRHELEKYDELPAHRMTILDDDDDDDDDDDTYSINDDYRYRHRRLPPVPSTAHRIINFVTSLKRQLQKNFHDIRSRILIEAMSNSSNHVSRHGPVLHVNILLFNYFNYIFYFRIHQVYLIDIDLDQKYHIISLIVLIVIIQLNILILFIDIKSLKYILIILHPLINIYHTDHEHFE